MSKIENRGDNIIFDQVIPVTQNGFHIIILEANSITFYPSRYKGKMLNAFLNSPVFHFV